MSLRARAWEASHSHHHAEFPGALIAARRDASVSVCLPAKNEAATIGPIVDALVPLLDAGVIDELVVVDDSTDGTAEIAAGRGATVHRQAELMPQLGAVLGKGDAMWRALSVLGGDVVCFLDADSEQFGAHYVCGLIGPLFCREPGAPGHGRAEVQFVKGFYRRPFRVGDLTLPEGGGRVTELAARPLLAQFYPELAHVHQPLAGEIAARRTLLERLAFTTGYGVDIALLLDAYAELGLDGIAQVDLDVRQNAHQSLRDLGPMAAAVLGAVSVRLQRDGRLSGPLATAPLERPALAARRAAA